MLASRSALISLLAALLFLPALAWAATPTEEDLLTQIFQLQAQIAALQGSDQNVLPTLDPVGEVSAAEVKQVLAQQGYPVSTSSVPVLSLVEDGENLKIVEASSTAGSPASSGQMANIFQVLNDFFNYFR